MKQRKNFSTKEGLITPAPQDLREKYRAEFRKEDVGTPYKLTVFPKNDMPKVSKFQDRDFAIMSFEETDDTAILHDFTNGVRFLRYRYVK